MGIVMTTAPACAMLASTSEDATDVTRLSGQTLLKISDDKLRHRHKATEEIERRIAQFRDEIEKVALHFSDSPVPGAGWVNAPSVR